MAVAKADVALAPSFADLPSDFLFLVFEQLELLDAIAAGRACSFWKTVCDESWELRSKQRWQHSSSRWRAMVEAGAWKKIYKARHQIDAGVRQHLELLCFPLRRRVALQAIEELGSDCVDALTLVAHSPEPMMIGRRYWAWMALTQVQMSRSSQKLVHMLREAPPTDTTAFEGALLLAQVHCPTQQLQWVRDAVHSLAAEFTRRLAQQQVQGGKQALAILSNLLFGASDASTSNTNSPQPPWIVGAVAMQPAAPAAPVDPSSFIPSEGYGLGLRGNAGDYYNPNNSLLHMVLQHRAGIPISLALIHMTVARLAGLQVEMLGLPGIVINRLPGEAREEALYIDVFDGGRVMSASQAQALALAMGLPPHSVEMPALAPANVLARMCNNLIDIYQNQFNVDMLSTVLRFATAVSPHNTELIYLQFMVSMRARHFREAHAALQAMEGAEGAGVVDDSQVAHVSNMRKLLEQSEAAEARAHGAAAPGKPRPDGVRFRVGDVVRHREYGYRGVVYEWDPCCEADDRWQSSTNVDMLPHGRWQPFYRILVDVRDRPFQCTYVPQDNIQLECDMAAGGSSASSSGVVQGERGIQHPNMGKYFEGLAAGKGQYKPNAYLRSRFPHDYVE